MVVRPIGLQTIGALAAQAQVPGFFVETPMQPYEVLAGPTPRQSEAPFQRIAATASQSSRQTTNGYNWSADTDRQGPPGQAEVDARTISSGSTRTRCGSGRGLHSISSTIRLATVLPTTRLRWSTVVSGR